MSKQAYDGLQAERAKLQRLHLEAKDRVEHAQNGGGDNEGLAGVEAVFEAEEIGGRLARIERELEEAIVVAGGGEYVVVGSRMELDFGDGAETYTFEHVAGDGVVGSSSPLGRAIDGRRAGEVVQVEAPGGQYTVKILSVK
jgi:transcription elongation factor GreA